MWLTLNIGLCLRQEWIDTHRAVIAKSDHAITIFGHKEWFFVLRVTVVELTICHAHVGKAVLRCCVVRVGSCSAVLLELFCEVRFKVLPRILEHRVFNSDYTRIVTRLYLAFQDLVGRCDALAAVTFQAIERELTELNFALFVWTFNEPWVKLFNTSTLHPISNFQKQTSTFSQWALWTHDSRSWRIDNMSAGQISCRVLRAS